MSHTSPIRFSYIPNIVLTSGIYIEDNVYFKFEGYGDTFQILFIIFLFFYFYV
jgi:hypothetical protein